MQHVEIIYSIISQLLKVGGDAGVQSYNINTVLSLENSISLSVTNATLPNAQLQKNAL